MIVEFIGCTGAGKSTLIPQVWKQVAERAEATQAFAHIARPLGLQSIKHPTVRNLIQEVVGLPYFVRALPRYREFVRYNLRIIATQLSWPLLTLTNLRSLERKLGVYEMIRREAAGKIILVDEGTMLQAHHLFVFTDGRLSPKEIVQFTRVLPLPDAVVYIRAPLEDLLARSLRRPDPPRVMRHAPPAEREKYLRRASALFDRLVQTRPILHRTLIVENPDDAQHEQARLVEQISEFILSSRPEAAPAVPLSEQGSAAMAG